MTLVMGCLTPDFAIQVCDRRLTVFAAGVPKYKLEGRNKGITFEGRFSIGYSGLAEIAGMPTDVWLSIILAQAPADDPFMFLADRLADAMRNSRLPTHFKRLAIIATGWITIAGRQGFFPAINVVSNAVMGNGSWLPEATADVRVHENWLDTSLQPGNWLMATPIGAPVPPSAMDSLWRRGTDALNRGVGPVAIARLFARVIRSVADSNETVGKDLLVTIVPRPILNPHNFVSTPAAGQMPRLSGIACYLIDNQSADLEWTMPNMVINGWAVTDVVMVRKGPEIGSITACFRVRGRGAAGVCLTDPLTNRARFLEMTDRNELRVREVCPGEPDRIISTHPVPV